MLYLIVRLVPPPLHRLGYRAAFHLRKRWLRLAGGEIHGCSLIARDDEGRVLLVRHSYGSGVWAFPGGGVRRGEDPLAAALREFAEELGCTVTDPLPVGRLVEDYHGTRNVAHLFTGLVAGEPRPDMRELVAARFFHPHDLPHDLAGNVRPRLDLLAGMLEQQR